MTASFAPDGDLPGVINGIRSGIDQAAELVNAIINGVNAVLSEMAPEVSGPVVTEAAKFQLQFNDTVTEIGHALSNVGDPAALRAAGSAWANDIGSTASNFAGFANASVTRADNYWTGKAAEHYTDALLPQRLALTDVKTIGNEIDTILNDLANAIFNFAISVGVTVAGLVASLAVAAASVASVIAAPLAVVLGGGAVAALSAGIIGLINSLKDIVSDVNTRTAELNRRVSDNTNFHNGAWPNATKERMGDGSIRETLSDGSITDGDDTDWHIK